MHEVECEALTSTTLARSLSYFPGQIWNTLSYVCTRINVYVFLIVHFWSCVALLFFAFINSLLSTVVMYLCSIKYSHAIF